MSFAGAFVELAKKPNLIRSAIATLDKTHIIFLSAAKSAYWYAKIEPCEEDEMLKLIKHAVNLAKNAVRDVGLAKRSDKWPALERRFRAEHPTCAACGGSDRLNVHHVKPYHDFPELELDPNNLITMCMGEKECHLKIAHCGNFKLYNPNVRADAADALAHPEQFEQIVKRAASEAKKN
jgi:hypothetical protein